MQRQRFWRIRTLPVVLVVLHGMFVVWVMQFIARDLADPTTLGESPLAWNLVVLLDFPMSISVMMIDGLWGPSLEQLVGYHAYVVYVFGFSILVVGSLQYWLIGTVIALIWKRVAERIRRKRPDRLGIPPD